MDCVPCSNFGISKTPIGPFHRTVPAFFNNAENSSIVFGPISSPIQLSGISVQSTILVSASLENLLATIVSVGKCNFPANSE